ncbi:tyrosine-type recombinase/integrase [Neobacillus sp. YIM B06451]|uniref:tyrosine-type recombinase/integrase n=1 Tax=Neobacillus sp. YIM B06451 TaxID=3070994 RepID=UPI00292FF34A|nr:tyrosine-type recombinase/integrase [Neobacillus sp. YIM B06451]
MEQIHSINQGNFQHHGKIKEKIDGNTSLDSAFTTMIGVKPWAANTITSYSNNIGNIVGFMRKENIEPLLGNVDFELVQMWISFLQKNEKSKTTKQRVAALSSIFSFFKQLGVLGANPFLAIKVAITDSGHHSRVLSLEELFEIYSAIRTEAELAVLELPISIDLMTGLRNVTLSKLRGNSIDHMEKGIKYGLIDDETGGAEEIGEKSNTKNKEGFIPLPPLLFQKVTQYIDDMKLKGQDSLLYGLQGKPLANKQLNHMVKKLCAAMGWTGDKGITPYSFRYTFATILGEMGVSDDAIRYGLGHSIDASKGSLARYVRLDERYKKELRTAQTILEEILETFLLLKAHHLMNLNINQISDELPDLYKRQLKDQQSIIHYKYHLIEMANKNKQIELMNMNGQIPMQNVSLSFQPYQQQNGNMLQPGMMTAPNYQYFADPNMNGYPIQHAYPMMPMNMAPQQQAAYPFGGQYGGTPYPVNPYIQANMNVLALPKDTNK